MKLLIDGDIVVYRAGFAADKTRYQIYTDPESATPAFESTTHAEIKQWIKDNPTDHVSICRTPEQGEVSAALAGARDIVAGIADACNCSDLQLYLTGEGNFRHEIATYKKYKGNRDSMRRPNHYDAIRSYLIKVWGATVTDNQEADDALGIDQTDDTTICSIDKDLLQIPGRHFNWVRDGGTHREVGKDEAEYLFYKQVLVGDTTDNIFGCPKIGEKTAEKLLANCKSVRDYWRAVVATYMRQFSRYTPEDMTIEDGRLVYRHWKSRVPISKTFEEYAEEVAQLVFIRKNGEQEWKKPLITQ